MQSGEFVKWVAADEQGQFEHQGVVGDVREESFDLKTDEGIMTINFSDGTVEKTKGTKKLETLAKGPKKKGKTKTTRKVGKKSTGGPTKLEQFRQIVTEMVEEHSSIHKVSRKAAIERAVEQVGMSKAGASTYFANIKREFLDRETT